MFLRSPSFVYVINIFKLFILKVFLSLFIDLLLKDLKNTMYFFKLIIMFNFFIIEDDHYQREFPDLPRQTKFWKEVFHNGFKCDYYNKYLDGQCHEILDRVYMILTQEYHHNAFISVFEVSMKLKQLVYFFI